MGVGNQKMFSKLRKISLRKKYVNSAYKMQCFDGIYIYIYIYQALIQAEGPYTPPPEGYIYIYIYIYIYTGLFSRMGPW